MKELRIMFVGFGNVGRELARLFVEKEAHFRTQGLLPRVVAIATRSRGTAVSPDGIDLGAVLRRGVGNAYPRSAPPCSLPAVDVIRATPADVVVEMTPLNVFSGEPAISHVEAALRTGKHVVLANKGPVAWAYRRLRQLADKEGRLMLFESTVMDGTPVFSMARAGLRGAGIVGFEGVLNSTTNFVLDSVANGLSADQAVSEAQRLGFAEADPSMDLEGYDAAAKVAALANVLMDTEINPMLVHRTGITHIGEDQILAAKSRGNAMRLVCRARLLENGVSLQTYPGSEPDNKHAGVAGVEATVAPQEVPQASLFGLVSGTSSVLKLHTSLMGTISIFEHDPGITQTAFGVVSDLIEVAREEQ